MLSRFQAKLDVEKTITVLTSKCATTTYTLPVATLGGDVAGGKDKKAPAPAKGKGAAGAKAAETLVKSDSAPVIGPIQMSSQFPVWVKVRSWLDKFLFQHLLYVYVYVI